MKNTVLLMSIVVYLMRMGFSPCHAQQSTKSVESVLLEKLTRLEDSVKVGDMVVYNAFKYQYLSQQGSVADTTLLIEKVFKPYPKLWNECLSKIFGEDGRVYERQGFINYNRKIFSTKRPLIESKLADLLSFNFDSLLSTHLKATKSLSGYAPKGKWIIFFGPDESLSLMIGGCSSQAMAIDLTHSKINSDFLIEAFPHELNHMVYEETHKNDVNEKTALGATIDEGLACYYTYQYFKGKMPKHSAVESMTKEEFSWYLQHEKEIFNKSKPYLFVKSESDTPYMCNCRSGGCKKLFNDAPKTICYFLGFRIIEAYDKKNGPNSWKKVYKLPVETVLEQSGYEAYVNSLK